MIIYHSRRAFWLGVAALTTGVALHLPMFFESAGMHYHLVGMPIDARMKLGMALIIFGTGLAAFGLVPRGAASLVESQHRLRVRALDDAPINKAHVGLLLVMALAVTIDVMKPTTLAFVLPGMTNEYGLRSPLNPGGHIAAAWFPFLALAGMVTGSVVWGLLGDRIGRRSSIVLASLLFIATSVCGSMPAFGWNLAMCFVMGAAVGGMLPIAFALLSETIPARHRSWLMVLIGGDVAGAYIITSFLASRLEPHYGWRILWLIGLPTGVFLIFLNRWVPESPRFLVATGRSEQAEAIMARFGARLVEVDESTDGAAEVEDANVLHYRQLLRPPLAGLSFGVALFGIGWGLVNNGFLLWLPTNLREFGFSVEHVNRLLANSALIGFPATFVVAWLYGFWSSKGTMVVIAFLTGGTLGAFAVMGNEVGRHPLVLEILIVLLLIGASSALAMLTPYASEVYPTRVRARGTGFAGTCARAGGFVGVGGVVAGVTTPNLTAVAVLGLVPMVLAALAIARYGIETRRRPLEEITSEELASVSSDLTPAAGELVG